MRPAIGMLSEISGQADGSGLYWVEALRCGSWDYPDMSEGGFTIDEVRLRELAAHFAAGEKGPDVPLNWNHDDDKPLGWVKAVEVRGAGSDAQLWAGFEITDSAMRSRVENRSVKYCSSEIDFAYVNPEACRTRGDCGEKTVLEGLALTNRPYVKHMAPIQLGERLHVRILSDFPDHRGCTCGERRETKYKEGHMPKTVEQLESELAETRTQLTEATKASATTAQLEEERKARLATEVRLRELEANTALSEAKGRLTQLVRKGRLTPAVARRALRLCEIAIRGGVAMVQLSDPVKVSKIRLAEGETASEEDVDKLDVVGEVLDMLQELPETIASRAEDEVALDEDGPQTEDDEEKAKEAALARCRENPKLSYGVVLAEEIQKRGLHKGRSGNKGGAR